MKLSEINNNPLSKAWKLRYSKLTDEKKKKIDALQDMLIPEYQLKIIKKICLFLRPLLKRKIIFMNIKVQDIELT